MRSRSIKQDANDAEKFHCIDADSSAINSYRKRKDNSEIEILAVVKKIKGIAPTNCVEIIILSTPKNFS